MFLYKFRSGHNVLMYLVTCYAILYFGLFEKAVSGFFFFKLMVIKLGQFQINVYLELATILKVILMIRKVLF